MRRRSLAHRALIAVGAALLALFWFGPFLLVGVGSVIPEGNLLSFPPNWFASPPFIGNYRYIFTGEIPQTYLERGAIRSMISQEVRLVPRAVLNSVLIAVAVMLSSLTLGSLAAYAYARLRFPGRVATFNFVLLSRLIPTVALAIPYYAIVLHLGLLNTHGALIAIYTVLTLPFTVLVLTLYFRTIPPEIDEAAQVEGASPLQVLRHITLPLSLPSLVGTGLFTFMLAYSEFLFALLISTSARTRTLPVTLGTLTTNPDVAWGLMMASIVVGSVPTLLLVFPVWRFMVRGLLRGALQ
jgi:ABC-type glycerol-3-phosphate transport system permease component